MERLRNCLDELVKLAVESEDLCSVLLKDDPEDPFPPSESVGGVPGYPLYRRLASALMRSFVSGGFCRTYKEIAMISEESWSRKKEREWETLILENGAVLLNILKDVACELCVEEPLFSLTKDGRKMIEGRYCNAEYDRLETGSLILLNKCLMLEVQEVHHHASFYEMLETNSLAEVFPGAKTIEEGMQMFRELYPEEKETSNGVIAIHVSKTVTQPYIILANLLSGLRYEGVQSLLGLSHTAGTIFSAFPPPRSSLLSSFMLPYKPQVKGCMLTHGARALAKHADRSSDKFWGVLHGSDSNKNELAMKVLNHLITSCCWMNVHIVQPHGAVFEVRVADGYGARWSQDGTKFIGFLEPYTDDGHSKRWKH